MGNVAYEVEQLREQIRHHDELYFERAKPEISDQEYDALMRRLLELEAAHPELITADSPSQRVGGKPIEGFATLRHAVRMMSIDNTYEEAGVREFDARVRRLLGTSNYRYTCEPKIDGVSLSVRYEEGKLVTAATRGDGMAGDDVTVNARTIRNIPLRLKEETRNAKRETRNKKEESLFGSGGGGESSETGKVVMEVRGEVFISRAQFARINAAQEEAGEETYANPRNTTAGTLKQLDSKIVAARKLEFLPHGNGELRGIAVRNYLEWQEILRNTGFRTNEHLRECADVENVLTYIREFADKRLGLPYETDGVVVKVVDFSQRDQLGVTAKAPRWCVAYKYQPERAETELARVVFQVGKTGTITPVAEFEPPVFISGTNVYRASLHNFDEVERKDIHLHDRVLVEKAGEVIPYVVGVVKEKRPAKAKKIARPKECPSCGNKELEQDGPFVRCMNPNCPAQLAERIRFWTGRGQMDIAEVGPALIETMLKAGVVRSIADLYRLKAEDLRSLVVSEYVRTDGEEEPDLLKVADGQDEAVAEGGGGGTQVTVTVGEKRAANIIKGVADSKDRGLAAVLAGLGILRIGRRTAQLVAQHFGSLEKLQEASLADILAAPEMGGGMLKDIEKLKERYAECADLSVEQVMGSAPIPKKQEEALRDAPSRKAHEKSPWELIEQLRGKGVAAKSLYDFLQSAAGQKTLADLVKLGLKMTEMQQKKHGPQPLAGMTIVVTGTLTHFTRGEIKQKIEELGGKAGETVSKATSFVVAGDEAGSKLEKARKLGVEVIDEGEFMKRIGTADTRWLNGPGTPNNQP